MIAVSFDGRSVREFGKAMKSADKEIRKEVRKAVTAAAKPVKDEVRKSAETMLPGSLGLWASAGLTLKVKQAYSAATSSVTVVGDLDNKKVKRGAGKGRRRSGTFGPVGDLKALNRGRVMHPAWGRAKKDGGLFGPQMVKAGFWDTPMRGPVAQGARKEIDEAMKRALARIAASAGTSS
jgi:hypothetical protein